MNIAILGTGKIGCDLLMKIKKTPSLNCVLFSGRRATSPGIAFAKQQGVATSCHGINDILALHQKIDLVFDASSASAHLLHQPLLQSHQLQVINLTPAPIGDFCIPSIDIEKKCNQQNISLVTCGGQVSIPIAHAIAQTVKDLHYIEVITTIAAKSAGSATRNNISEYQCITQQALTHYSHCQQTKSILVVNPAEPPITMQTTIYFLAEAFNLPAIEQLVTQIVRKIQAYVPGYQLITKPIINNGRLVIMLKVTGAQDYLPSYAGNLDIITSSAIEIATSISKKIENKTPQCFEK